jgi:hypothetical protein
MEAEAVKAISIFLGWAIYCVWDGYSDFHNWRGYQKQGSHDNKKWHTKDFFGFLFLLIGMAIGARFISWQTLIFFVQLAMIRKTLFEITLNRLRGKNWWYVSASSNWMDALQKQHEKPIFYLCVLLNLISIAYLIYSL